MTDNHDMFADWSAAYTLGALECKDRRAFEDHLATCSICTAEVASFAPLPGLLSQVGLADMIAQPDPAIADLIETEAKEQVSLMHQAKRRWKTAALMSAAAVVLLAALVLLPTRDTSPEFAATINTSLSESAEIGMNPKSWGTEIILDLTGLPTRDSYQLWVVDSNGVWTSAATWSPTPAGVATLTGATLTPFSDVDRIVITSADQGDVLIDASA